MAHSLKTVLTRFDPQSRAVRFFRCEALTAMMDDLPTNPGADAPRRRPAGAIPSGPVAQRLSVARRAAAESRFRSGR